MKTKFLKTVLPVMLLVVAAFIIGSGCTGTPDEMTYRWYEDADGDGYGQWVENPIEQHDQPAGYVLDKTDCDDTNPDIYPNAPEIPDNFIDENCNGVYAVTFYKDSDDDGFGNPNVSDVYEIELGEEAPAGFVSNNADCDDTDDMINPLANEIVGNDIDDNCDGITDEFEIYIDTDGDGYGSNQFAAGPGVHNNIDCDDTDGEVYPYQQEILDNGVDDNCNGIIDEIN
jgi:hypothetical protein